MPGIAIKAQNLSKSHQIYTQPHDRLRQSIYPHLQSLIGKLPKKYFPEF
jgi:lipopolysaccharide transport system ATP-binding protein